MSTGLFDDADVISTYSRAQAIEDGVLVDLRQGELEELVVLGRDRGTQLREPETEGILRPGKEVYVRRVASTRLL
jgi:hypothetical protein